MMNMNINKLFVSGSHNFRPITSPLMEVLDVKALPSPNPYRASPSKKGFWREEKELRVVRNT